ncbi:MAG TPA: PAS domain S-box protein, partial [Methanocella sp.]|nr:PAS domain S-box protein [Methanocella sp.]
MQTEAARSPDEGRTWGELIEELDRLRRETAALRMLCGEQRTAGECAQELEAEVTSLKKEVERLHTEAVKHCVELNQQIEELVASGEAQDTSERRCRTIGELIPYGVWMCGPDGGMVYLSPSFVELVGLPAGQLMGWGWTKALPEEDRERTVQDWKACVARGGYWDYEYRVFGTDGQPHSILSRGLPVKDARGHIESWAGIHLDITERKRVEEELRLSDRMFDVLVNANIIGIFVSGSDGTIIEANDSYLDIVGRAREDLKEGHVNYIRMTPPEHWKLHKAKEQELISSGHMAPHEMEYIRKDGSRVPVLLGMGLLDDRSLARIGYVIDLTEHRRREMLLKRYRLMFETIRDPILFIRRDGQIVDANYAAVETYGYSHKELLAMNVNDLRVLGEQTEMLEKLEQCFKHGCQFEAVHRRKDGSTMTFDISAKGMLFGDEKILVTIARDITDRKRSEELVRRKQRELETVLDTLPGSVVFKDTNSVYVMANLKACEAMGVGKASVAGRTDYDFYPRRMAEKYRADDWRAISSGRPLYDMEEEMQQNGRPVTVITSKVPLKNDLGMVVGIISLSLDISGRKRAEEALLHSTASLAKAERIASLGNWEWDFRSGRLRWSDGNFIIFGYPPGDVEPEYEVWRERVHPDDVLRVEKALEASILRDKPFKVDYRVVWPDGSLHHVHAEADRPIRDAAGKPERMFGIVQDITERKRIEEERLEREAALDEAQQIARMGSWVWDLGEDRVQWSDGACRIFGLTPPPSPLSLAAMLGYVHPDDRGSVEYAVRESIATGAAYDQEHRIVRADGSVHFVRSQAKVVAGPDGRPARMLGSVRDVTERRQYEEVLEQAKDQAELYIDLMAHDINNMNQVALGNLEFALEALLERGKLEKGDRPFIDRSMDTLKSSSVLIDNVRKLRDLCLGRYKAEIVDLGALLKDVKATYSSLPGREVAIHLAAEPGSLVEANVLLKDVFTNLVGNAIRHSSGPVDVWVTLDRIKRDEIPYYRV